MALPAVQLGVPYKLNLGGSLGLSVTNGSSSTTLTYHSLNYVPASHAVKGKVPPVIDAHREASIVSSTRRGSEDSSVELTFIATNGETNVVTGSLLPSRNEFVLLFDGTAFNLHPLTSSVLSMTESKNTTDRKRPASESLEGAPDAKKPKLAQSTASPVSTTSTEAYSSTSSVSSTSSNPSSNSSVSFSLQTKTKKSAATAPTSIASASNIASSALSHVASAAQSAPITPVSASSIVSPSEIAPKLLTKSTEMRMAKWDEPDSDDSDDSD